MWLDSEVKRSMRTVAILASCVMLTLISTQSARSDVFGVAALAGSNSSAAHNPFGAASASGSGAAAHADWSVSLGASATAGGLVFNAGGAASFLSSFDLSGNANSGPVSLIFNFVLSGSLDGDAPKGATAVANYQGHIGTKDSSLFGGGSLTCGNGVCTPPVHSASLGDASAQVTITPEVNVSGSYKELLPSDLPSLPGNYSFTTKADDYSASLSTLQGVIIQDLSNIGLPRFSVAPGVEVDLNYKTTVTYETHLHLPVTLSGSDALDISLSSSAIAFGGGQASADFEDTLKLTSVTLLDSSVEDVSPLSLVFASGLVVPIQPFSGRVSDGGTLDIAEPGPASLLVAWILTLWLTCSRRRLSS
jgi:hypothetical protein